MVKLSVSSIIALSAAATVLSAPIPNYSSGQDAYNSSKTPCATPTADQQPTGYTPSTPLPYESQLPDLVSPTPSSTPCSGTPTATQLNDGYAPPLPTQVVESVQSANIPSAPSSTPCSGTPTATQLNDGYTPPLPTQVVESVQSANIPSAPSSTPCSGTPTATQLNDGYTPAPQGPDPNHSELPENISPPSAPSVPANLDYGYEGNMSPSPTQDVQSDYGINNIPNSPSQAELPALYQPLPVPKKKKCVRKVRKCKPRRRSTGVYLPTSTPTVGVGVDAFNPSSTNVPTSNDYSYGSSPVANNDGGKNGIQDVSPASTTPSSSHDYSYGSSPASNDYGQKGGAQSPNAMGYAY